MPKRRPKIRPLQSEQKEAICKYIVRLAPTGRRRRDPMRTVARRWIADALWRWTADGYDRASNEVVIDGVKYDHTLIPTTASARAQLRRGERTGLRHEHVVPRKLLADRIVDERMDIDEVRAFLDRYCKAVIMTAKESTKLVHRRMPDDWKWDRDSKYGRIQDARLDGRLRMPWD